MRATDVLREDHRQIRRLGRVIELCHTRLVAGDDIPLDDIERIIRVIDGFLDSVHYSREEDSYFPCVASYGHLNEEIRKLMIEHEFSRRIAASLSRHLARWKAGRDSREPVARYLRTYLIYLNDHMRKEETFFERAEAEVLSAEEEREMYEQFRSTVATASRLDAMIQEVSYLEGRPWCES